MIDVTTTRPTAKRRGRNDTAGDFLDVGGQMGALIRTMDWAKTSLGPIGNWPQSLRTAVNFPISLARGPTHVQVYNDGYWPICATSASWPPC